LHAITPFVFDFALPFRAVRLARCRGTGFGIIQVDKYHDISGAKARLMHVTAKAATKSPSQIAVRRRWLHEWRQIK
jgi:hypothetical protein